MLYENEETPAPDERKSGYADIAYQIKPEEAVYG